MNSSEWHSGVKWDRFRPQTVLRLLPIACVVPLLASCNRGILDPVGPVGAAEKQILINSTAIMLAIIVPTMIATVAFAWWFRRGNTKADYRPDWEYSGAIEFVVWSIPALTIMLLGGIAWIGSHDLEPSKPLASTVAAAQRRRRFARLEMAVHLPRPGHRDGQSAGRSGRERRSTSA